MTYVVYEDSPEPHDRIFRTRSAGIAHEEYERRLHRVSQLYGPAYALYFSQKVLRCDPLHTFVLRWACSRGLCILFIIVMFVLAVML